MSFTSRYSVLFWNNLKRMKGYYHIQYKKVYNNKINIAVTPTIGFSFFTWLGFDNKKLSAEDEIIISIKHSILLIQRNEYDKAERLLHVALRQAQQVQHQQGITYIYDVMANLALQREQLDKAKSLFIAVSQRLMSDGVTEDDLRIVQISVKLARISHLKKEFDVAQLGYNWCLEKLNNAKETEATPDVIQLFALTQDWYGRLYLDCNQNETGLILMADALKLMRNIDNVDKEHIAVQLNDLGTVCDRLNKLDESIEYFKEAITVAKDVKDMEDLGALYVNLGNVYIKKNLLEEARKSCGYGWKLAHDNKRDDIKEEANTCIDKIKSLC